MVKQILEKNKFTKREIRGDYYNLIDFQVFASLKIHRKVFNLIKYSHEL